jgi:hypothetical protein
LGVLRLWVLRKAWPPMSLAKPDATPTAAVAQLLWYAARRGGREPHRRRGWREGLTASLRQGERGRTRGREDAKTEGGGGERGRGGRRRCGYRGVFSFGAPANGCRHKYFRSPPKTGAWIGARLEMSFSQPGTYFLGSGLRWSCSQQRRYNPGERKIQLP